MKIHKKLNLVSVQRELRERGMLVFTPKEFERVFGVADTAARQFIAYYTKKHFFSKLRNGLYSLEGQRPNLYFAANKLYRPSYVSLETALFCMASFRKRFIVLPRLLLGEHVNLKLLVSLFGMCE
jgi:hypothetical protein